MLEAGGVRGGNHRRTTLQQWEQADSPLGHMVASAAYIRRGWAYRRLRQHHWDYIYILDYRSI